jgi:hippurate hydrolase
MVGVIVSSEGVSAPAADYFKIQIQGKGCHGSAPWKGVDALTVAARVLLGLQELNAREISVTNPAVLTIGSLPSGEAGNALSDKAVLYGTLRSFDEATRLFVKERMEDVAKNIAKAFRARAKISYQGGCPTLVNDGGLSAFVYKTAGAVSSLTYLSNDLAGDSREKNGGSEDFAYISQEIPSVLFAISAGAKQDGYAYPLHYEKVRFDENALWVGSYWYAACAMAFDAKKPNKKSDGKSVAFFICKIKFYFLNRFIIVSLTISRRIK